MQPENQPSSVPEELALLRSCLATITDPRHSRGRIHPLDGVLTLSVLGLMADCRSLSAIHRWGELHQELFEPLGLRRSPSVPTLGRLLRGVSIAQVRQALRSFVQTLLESRGYREGFTVAADGKSLRGVWEEGKQLGLVHFFVHQAQLTLDQEPATYHLDEVKATQNWVEEVAREVPGLKVLTGDAPASGPELVRCYRSPRGGLFHKTEKNQPTLYQDVVTLFSEPGEPELVVVEKGHGRLERREVRSSGELAVYSDFPGLKQVIQVKKRVVRLKSGEVSESVRYGITSLDTQEAGPEELLGLFRGHWGVENREFHVKDDSFGEDRQVLQSHHRGCVLSLLRDMALGLLRGHCALWQEPAAL